MSENEQLNPEELQVNSLKTKDLLPEVKENLDTTITDQLEGKSPEELEVLKAELQEQLDILNAEDLDVKTYLRVSPTFYIKAVETEELDDEGEPLEIFKILNPETGVVEERELTDDEKKELFVRQLKESRKVFNPLSHPTKVVGQSTMEHPILKGTKGKPARVRVIKEREVQTNITTNKFGAEYKKKRQTRNKLAKASRKANR